MQDTLPVKVDDKLFIGSISSTYDMTKLKELGITHIVNACSSDFLYEEVSILLDWSSIGIRHTSCSHQRRRYKRSFEYSTVYNFLYYVWPSRRRSISVLVGKFISQLFLVVEVRADLLPFSLHI